MKGGRKGGRPRRPVGARSKERRVKPTAPTVARLRRDQVQHLYEKGRLRHEHLRAADEIRRIWQAFSRCLGPAAVDYSSLAQVSRRKQPRQAIEWLTAKEELIWRNRYRPWAQEMSVIRCGSVLPVSRLQVIFDLSVENYSLRQIDGQYRMRHGSSFEHLRDGLHRYAQIAQWIQEDIAMPDNKLS